MNIVLNELYYCKKAILMVENYENLEKVNEIYKQVEGKLVNIKTFDDLTSLIMKYSQALRNLIPEKMYETWKLGDYENYTYKHHRNSYWNEIPNHKSIQDFLEKVVEILNVPNEPAKYAVSLYDLNNYDIIFGNESDLKKFINQAVPDPYTVFEIEGNVWNELYSV
jgi:hypothetical protein